jgi:hypothetical protein
VDGADHERASHPQLIAVIIAVAAGAILAMLADTMIPRCVRECPRTHWADHCGRLPHRTRRPPRRRVILTDAQAGVPRQSAWAPSSTNSIGSSTRTRHRPTSGASVSPAPVVAAMAGCIPRLPGAPGCSPPPGPDRGLSPGTATASPALHATIFCGPASPGSDTRRLTLISLLSRSREAASRAQGCAALVLAR